MLILDCITVRKSPKTLAADLCEKDFLRRVAAEEGGILEFFEFDEAVDKSVKLRIFAVLHHIIVPSCSDLDHLIDILSDLLLLDLSTLQFWIETHEAVRQILRDLYVTRNVTSLGEYFTNNFEKSFCLDSDSRYENILHQAVNDDFIQCTALLTAPYIIVHSDCINQTNYQGDTPLHLAAKQLKISHLRLLIRSGKANLQHLNRDDRNVFHLLLISAQKRWSTQRSMALKENKMFSRSPPPSEMISLLSEMMRIINCCKSGAAATALRARDRYNQSVLCYSVNLTNVGIFGIITAEIRLQHDCATDDCSEWNTHMRRCILINSFEIVTLVANQYVHYYERIPCVASAPHQQKDKEGASVARLPQPIDYIVFAIESECKNSLHSLLSIPTFRQSVNNISSSGVSPLEAAVNRFAEGAQSVSVCAATAFHLDVLRTLLRQGADPLKSRITTSPTEIPNKTDCRYEPEPSHSAEHPLFQQIICRNVTHNALVSTPDNIFALAASLGAIHALRLLCNSIPGGKCIPSMKSKTKMENSDPFNCLNSNGSYVVGFFLGHTRFESNPLLFAVANDHIACLQYLLDSSFSNLINYMSIENMVFQSNFPLGVPSECTPLSVAVLSGNIAMTDLLLQNGANPSVLLRPPNASAVKSAHIFEEMAECVKRMGDALYSTILHSSSDGEKSETETGTLHTAIQTISKTDVTHGGINSIDAEKRNAVDDVMVRARNTFTYDSRSKDASGVAVETLRRSISSLSLDDVRLLGVACASCAPLKGFMSPILSAVKLFLPPEGRDLSQRDWERILLSRPSTVICTLQVMCECLVQDSQSQNISRSVSLLCNAMSTFERDAFLWQNNLKARRCTKAVTAMHKFCTVFNSTANDILNTQRESQNKPTNCLEKLKCEYEYLQNLYSNRFSVPSHIRICNYSVKLIHPYPGCRFQESRSIDLCSAIDAVQIRSLTRSSESPTRFPVSRIGALRGRQGGVVMRSEGRKDLDLGYLPPSLLSRARTVQNTNVRATCGEYLWWDASAARDWPLLKRLLPTAARIEGVDLELLLLFSITNGAGTDVVSDFIRAGVVLGSVTEHIVLSGTRGDHGSFLILLLAGAATPHFNRNHRVQGPRQKLVQDFLKRISRGISKVSRLRTEYSSILNRGARLSVFDSDAATSRVRSDELNNSTLHHCASNVTHLECEEDTDLPIETSISLSDNEEQFEGTPDLHPHSIYPIDAAPSSSSPKNIPKSQAETAVEDPRLSMELGVQIIKNVISLLADCRIEDDEDFRDPYHREEVIPEVLVDMEHYESINRVLSAPSSSSYSRVRQGIRPLPCHFQLWDDFLSPTGTFQERVPSPIESTDSTVQRILRLIMQKGSAATVRETVKTLLRTFGHSSGNVLLGSSRCSEQDDSEGDSQLETCLSVAAAAGNAETVSILLDSMTPDPSLTADMRRPDARRRDIPRSVNYHRTRLAGTSLIRPCAGGIPYGLRHAPYSAHTSQPPHCSHLEHSALNDVAVDLKDCSPSTHPSPPSLPSSSPPSSYLPHSPPLHLNEGNTRTAHSSEIDIKQLLRRLQDKSARRLELASRRFRLLSSSEFREHSLNDSDPLTEKVLSDILAFVRSAQALSNLEIPIASVLADGRVPLTAENNGDFGSVHSVPSSSSKKRASHSDNPSNPSAGVGVYDLHMTSSPYKDQGGGADKDGEGPPDTISPIAVAEIMQMLTDAMVLTDEKSYNTFLSDLIATPISTTIRIIEKISSNPGIVSNTHDSKGEDGAQRQRDIFTSSLHLHFSPTNSASTKCNTLPLNWLHLISAASMCMYARTDVLTVHAGMQKIGLLSSSIKTVQSFLGINQTQTRILDQTLGHIPNQIPGQRDRDRRGCCVGDWVGAADSIVSEMFSAEEEWEKCNALVRTVRGNMRVMHIVRTVRAPTPATIPKTSNYHTYSPYGSYGITGRGERTAQVPRGSDIPEELAAADSIIRGWSVRDGEVSHRRGGKGTVHMWDGDVNGNKSVKKSENAIEGQERSLGVDKDCEEVCECIAEGEVECVCACASWIPLGLLPLLCLEPSEAMDAIDRYGTASFDPPVSSIHPPLTPALSVSESVLANSSEIHTLSPPSTPSVISQAIAAALNMKWHLINATKGRISDPVRFGALINALGCELQETSSTSSMWGVLQKDHNGCEGSLGYTSHVRTYTSDKIKAYEEISSELLDVLVTQLQDTLSYRYNSCIQHTHSTESHSLLLQSLHGVHLQELKSWKMRIRTAHHIFLALKCVRDQNNVTRQHHLTQSAHTHTPSEGGEGCQLSALYLNHALVQGIRSGSVSVVQMLLNITKEGDGNASRDMDTLADSTSSIPSSSSPSSSPSPPSSSSPSPSLLKSISALRKAIEEHLMAAAATGNLSVIQLLITHYKNEYTVRTEKYDFNHLNYPTYGFEETKSAQSKWTVVHALLTGCETEAVARKKAQNIEDSERNSTSEEKNMEGKSVENDLNSDHAKEVKEKMKVENMKSSVDSSPGLRCVGSVWLRRAVCCEGRGSSVRGSKAVRMRERSQVLDLLLRTVLTGGDAKKQESQGEEVHRSKSGSDAFKNLFSAEELGASLLYHDIEKRSTGDLSGKGHETPLSLSAIPSCLDLAALSGYWSSVLLMLRGSSGISAIQGLHLHRSSTAYSQSQYSGSSRVGYCFPLLHCAALDGRKDVFEWMNKYFEGLNLSAESKLESDQRSQDGLPQYFKLEAVYRLLTSTRTFTLPVPVIGSLPASVSVSKRRASHQSSRNGTSRMDLSSRTDSTLSLHLSTLYPTPHEVEQDHFPSGHHVHPHTNPDTSSLHLQCDLNVDTDCSLSSSTLHSNFHGDSVRLTRYRHSVLHDSLLHGHTDLPMQVSLLTVRVLEQLSLIRRELIKTNYPSSIPTTPTPYNGSNGDNDFEVSGYYDIGLLQYAIVDRSDALLSHLLSPPWSLSAHQTAALPPTLLARVGCRKVQGPSRGFSFIPLEIAAITAGGRSSDLGPHIPDKCRSKPSDSNLSRMELMLLQKRRKDMREKEKEEDREDVEEAVHGASFSRLVQRHLENIISQLSDEVSSKTSEKQSCRQSASLLCCQLIVAKSELRMKAAVLADESGLLTVLQDNLRSAFHQSLYNANDAIAAHILSRLLAVAYEGSPKGSVDVSEVLDSVIDRGCTGVQMRNKYIRYCCASNCAHVLHLLLSAYTLEWSIVTLEESVHVCALRLLGETVHRGHAACSAVLLFHMHKEGLEPQTVFSLVGIPSKTYVALRRMSDILLGTKEG